MRARESCPRCEAYAEVEQGRTHAICRLKDVGFYDATKAEALVRRRWREPVVISARRLRQWIKERSVYPPHCLHVNTRKYIIIGTYLDPHENNDERQFILDGSHRGFIRSRTGKATKAYVLTLAETLSVFDGKNPPQGKVFVTDNE